MAIGRLLVIAPEIDLRRSLEFALSAEGFLVESRSAIDLDGPFPGERYDCTILDQEALIGPAEQIASFCRRARPVVLLSDNPIPWLSGSIAEIVEKPLLGSALARAVRFALELEA